ncbi:MAG: right-handed parallel beta-helix repeat-containing protein [Gemmatimonadota bacterium]|nr:MAG: right-handed parallel beta-helix repeat-containing protein [Gemmatimonadota bacterium]
MRKIFSIMFLLALCLGSQWIAAQEIPSDEEPLPLEEPFHMPGRVEGTGTHFEITDSEYLNITLESSEEIGLALESVPRMVTMFFDSSTSATSTTITLSGFTPATTYYKYEDNYHNLEEMTTDGNGSYTYIQDISAPHPVFIQPQPSTKFIPSDLSIGTWDPVSRIYTLTTDVYETIQIDEDNLTLDGTGHTVTGPGGSGYGVYLDDRTAVTLKNLTVQGFYYGICLSSSSNNTVTGNTASNNNSNGIYLPSSSNNTLTANTTSSNSRGGIYLTNNSNSNTLTANTSSNNQYGIYLSYSSNNTLSGNTMLNNRWNFYVYGSDSHYDHTIDKTNTVEGKPIYYIKDVSNQIYDSTNSIGTLYLINCDHITVRDLDLSKNNIAGIFLWNTHYSEIDNVTASNNAWGIRLWNSSNNTLTGNTTSNGSQGIYLFSSSSNILNDNTASNNFGGIILDKSSDNTLTGNAADSNSYYGIGVYRNSNNNNLTDNTTLDNQYGIYLWEYSDNNTLSDNTASHNDYSGISLNRSNNNTLNGNTSNSNSNYGISLYYSNDNTMTDNTASNNSGGMNFMHASGNVLNDNTTNSNRNRGIWLRDSNNNTMNDNTASYNGYGIVIWDCIGNSLSGNLANFNILYGIELTSSSNNTLTGNITSSNGSFGISLWTSDNNTLAGNTASNNTCGIRLYKSSNGIFTGNTVWKNRWGISMNDYYNQNNQIYHNNFIANGTQVDYEYRYNVFYLPKPIGGNYWSDWTSPDDDGDGFVDVPYYIYYRPQDYLPWTEMFPIMSPYPVSDAGPDQTVLVDELITFDGCQSYEPEGVVVSYEWDFGDGISATGQVATHAYDQAGIYSTTLTITDNDGAIAIDQMKVTVLTPAEACVDLISTVESMNLQQGIENGLDAKLEAVQDALVAANAGVRSDAINKLEAFINAVEAQRGKQLTDEQADELVDYANRIIANLGGSPSARVVADLIPTAFQLAQNAPNPFNPETEIAFSLPENTEVTITVYNVLGQEVTSLVNGVLPAGSHSVTWNATDLPSGVYFYRINAKSFTATRRMVFMK